MAECIMCGNEFEKWVDEQEACLRCINKEKRKNHEGAVYTHECVICGRHYMNKAYISKTCSGKCVAKLKQANRLSRGISLDEKNELIKQALVSRNKKVFEKLNRPFTEDTVYLIHKWFYEYTSACINPLTPKAAIKTICFVLDRSEASVLKALAEVVPSHQVKKWEELNWKECKFGGSINVQES